MDVEQEAVEVGIFADDKGGVGSHLEFAIILVVFLMPGQAGVVGRSMIGGGQEAGSCTTRVGSL
jgi:hypothetical protein